MTITTPTTNTGLLSPSIANRVAAITAFLTALAAAVAGAINVMPKAWQSTVLAGIGIIGAIVTCLHFMLGAQKYDAQQTQLAAYRLQAEHDGFVEHLKAHNESLVAQSDQVHKDIMKFLENQTTPVIVHNYTGTEKGSFPPIEESDTSGDMNIFEEEKSPADKARAMMGTIMNYLHNHQSQIGYMETRSPDDIMSSHGMSWTSFQAFIARGGSIVMDCSETCIAICRWCGLLDPDGPSFDYNGFGNTQTMMDYLPHISDWHDVHEGTIIVFDGPMSEQHAVMVLEKNLTQPDNPTVMSHGSPPVFIGPFSDIAPYFINRGQHAVPLAIAGLLPKPKPSMHYDRFDDTEIQLANDRNTERNVVRNYDKFRPHPDVNAVQLARINANLGVLITRIEHNMKEDNDPEGKKDNRKWRREQLIMRQNNEIVEPTI